jgi:hypothetical protein
MSRNLKSLGLALLAVLVTSAIATSPAQAAPTYTASAYPATITGSNTAGKETWTTPAGTVQCDSHFQASLSAPSSTLAIVPKYTNCVAFGFLNGTIQTNGCAFVLHTTEQVAPSHYRHHVDISCPTGSPGIVTTWGTCEVDIPPQTGLTTITTQNSGSALTLVWNMADITMNVTKDGFGCPWPTTGHYKGSYHGDVVLSRVGGGSVSVSGF